jgi:hypothetical protein
MVHQVSSEKVSIPTQASRTLAQKGLEFSWKIQFESEKMSQKQLTLSSFFSKQGSSTSSKNEPAPSTPSKSNGTLLDFILLLPQQLQNISPLLVPKINLHKKEKRVLLANLLNPKILRKPQNHKKTILKKLSKKMNSQIFCLESQMSC